MAETAVDRRLDAAGRGGTRAGLLSSPMAACRRWSPVAPPLADTPNPAAPRAPACAISGGTAARSMTASSPGRCRRRSGARPCSRCSPASPARPRGRRSGEPGRAVRGPVGISWSALTSPARRPRTGRRRAGGDVPDLAAQVAKARPAPVAEAREGARDTTRDTARRPAARARATRRLLVAWQNPASARPRPRPLAGSRGDRYRSPAPRRAERAPRRNRGAGRRLRPRVPPVSAPARGDLPAAGGADL